ncbi:MAG TPA: hypothetical protein VN805_14840 [Caulobacteraceae bacterium]|nr:hypothetical protein [Caulobacteraceae bacterium]
MAPHETGVATPLTREVDRLYGELLLVLAVLSAAAPLFVEATLAWSLLLTGVAGVWWIAIDRTLRGLLAGLAWALIALGLGLHLTFHFLLGALPLDIALGGGFLLLGIAELWFGLERFRRRPTARLVTVAGGAVAIVFGLSVPFAWPNLPSWAGAATVSLMLAGLGGGLLIGSARRRRRHVHPVETSDSSAAT